MRPSCLPVKLGSAVILACWLIACNTASVYPTQTASWYSKADCIKEGSSSVYTASGKRFDENALTAASWFYPFGSKVKVTSLNNGKTINVTINDRGPAKRLVKKGRVLDLSRGAFEKLAPLSEGVIPIKLEAL